MKKSAKFQSTLNMRSYAKINLSLDVLGKTDNGYHQLCMMMQTVSLHDDIQITKTRHAGQIELACNSPYVPCDERNIAYKAAKLMFDTYPEATNGFGVFIRIEKRIPVAAGLAGGSGNAAAVLHGINRLFQLKLSVETLCALGVTLGADVPYCLVGGTKLSEGIGEILTPLPSFPKLPIVLVNPGKPLSTKAVFGAITDIPSLPHPNTPALLEALQAGDVEKFLSHTANSLEAPAISAMPEIASIKEDLMKKGALGAMMSGSGPTVFGIFDDVAKAREAVAFFRKKRDRSFLTSPVL